MFPQSARSFPYDRAHTSPSSADFFVFAAGSLVVRYFAAASFPSRSTPQNYERAAAAPFLYGFPPILEQSPA